MSRPERAYLICANQRSGSTLVCRALADTGVAGRPEEYFLAADPSAFPEWGFWEDGPFAHEHGGVGSRREYVDLVYRLGTTANGVFGAKLMWNNVEWVVAKFRQMDEFAGMRRRADIFRAAFPDLRVVHLIRRDVVRQAVSWARAAQDGIWVVSQTEPPKSTAHPEYSFDFISNLLGLLLQGERGWRRLTNELGLTPHTVVYEDLLTRNGYRATIRGVLRHLELDDRLEIAAPRTTRQADDTNEAWVSRFLADARGRNHPALGLMTRRHIPASG